MTETTRFHNALFEGLQVKGTLESETYLVTTFAIVTLSSFMAKFCPMQFLLKEEVKWKYVKSGK